MYLASNDRFNLTDAFVRTKDILHDAFKRRLTAAPTNYSAAVYSPARGVTRGTGSMRSAAFRNAIKELKATHVAVTDHDHGDDGYRCHIEWHLGRTFLNPARTRVRMVHNTAANSTPANLVHLDRCQKRKFTLDDFHNFIALSSRMP